MMTSLDQRDAARKASDAATAASNFADLVAFVARTAKDHAFHADEDAFLGFHEIRLTLEGAERLIREHAEALEKLADEIQREAA